MPEILYDRKKVYDYAREWAFKRNKKYLNFDRMGGDCTNFASQCIYAGAGVMNMTPVYGWYYISGNNRTASWTGVEYLYNFLVNNKKSGPYGRLSGPENMKIGDIVQLGRADGSFYHTPVIVGLAGRQIYVAAHSDDAFMRPLDSYSYARIRYIHIDGVRR